MQITKPSDELMLLGVCDEILWDYYYYEMFRLRIIEKMVICVASTHARVLFYGSVPTHMIWDSNCFDSLFCYIMFSFSCLLWGNALLFEMHGSILFWSMKFAVNISIICGMGYSSNKYGKRCIMQISGDNQ